DAGSVRARYRRGREAHRSSGLGSDSSPDSGREVHGVALSARRQEIARTVRDPDAQTDHLHFRGVRKDDGRAFEVEHAGGSRHPNQGVTEPTATRGAPAGAPSGHDSRAESNAWRASSI